MRWVLWAEYLSGKTKGLMNFGDAKNMPPVFGAKLSRYLNYSEVALTVRQIEMKAVFKALILARKESGGVGS